MPLAAGSDPRHSPYYVLQVSSGGKRTFRPTSAGQATAIRNLATCIRTPYSVSPCCVTVVDQAGIGNAEPSHKRSVAGFCGAARRAGALAAPLSDQPAAGSVGAHRPQERRSEQPPGRGDRSRHATSHGPQVVPPLASSTLEAAKTHLMPRDRRTQHGPAGPT